MAALALPAFLAAVDVVELMAVDTLLRQIFPVQVAAVAGAAYQFAVLALQWEIGAAVVVETRGFPAAIVVTVTAFAAIATVVGVVVTVTAAACRFWRLMVDRIDVAALAAHPGMSAFEREFGIATVVETGFFPVPFVVAVGALRAVGALVCVVQRMAAVAQCRSLFVLLVDVTSAAGGGAVCAVQCKVGRVMIEGEFPPFRGAVTVAALFSQFALVTVMLFVAVDTGRGRFRVSPVRSVAGGAGHVEVRARELEIGLPVIERQRIETDNVGIAAQVFAVTVFAVDIGAVREAPMVALAGCDILAHLLVTVQTQARLGSFPEPQMAVRTGGLQLRMPLDDFAGH
jgi:hypothetical protein